MVRTQYKRFDGAGLDRGNGGFGDVGVGASNDIELAAADVGMRARSDDAGHADSAVLDESISQVPTDGKAAGAARWRKQGRRCLRFMGSPLGIVVALVVLVVLVITLYTGTRPGSGSSSGGSGSSGSHSVRSGMVLQGTCVSDDSIRPRNVTLLGRPRMVSGLRGGAVAADHPTCSDEGVKVLQEGGNAVDALVATVLCQGVLNPAGSGIGGGGFMLLYMNGEPLVIDAREIAPAASNTTMFSGANKGKSLVGGLASGVPLELLGLEQAHLSFGQLPWRRLVMPAQAFAADGFPAGVHLSQSLKGRKEALDKDPVWKEVADTFLVEDAMTGQRRPPEPGEQCCQRPALGRFLMQVADKGAKAVFSSPEVSESLAQCIQEHGGIMTAADIASAAAEVKPAMRMPAMGLELLLPPPPSSAGLIAFGLRVLEAYEPSFSEAPGTQRMVETMKHMYAVRSHFGDPADPAVKISQVLADLQSEEFVQEIRSLIDDDRVQDPGVYGGRYSWEPTPEDAGTSHISILDSEGNAAAMTTTVNTAFGSKVICKDTGMLMNNQMDDFSSPDQSNAYGYPPTVANYISPGKKPLSSMSPMIMLRNNSVAFVAGASGGSRIISGTFQTALRVLVEGKDVLTAVGGARLHHQLRPNQLGVESHSGIHVPEGVWMDLAQRGQEVTRDCFGASCQVILVDPVDGTISAASDIRKDAAAAGF